MAESIRFKSLGVENSLARKILLTGLAPSKYKDCPLAFIFGCSDEDSLSVRGNGMSKTPSDLASVVPIHVR